MRNTGRELGQSLDQGRAVIRRERDKLKDEAEQLAKVLNDTTSLMEFIIRLAFLLRVWGLCIIISVMVRFTASLCNISFDGVLNVECCLH